MKKLLFFFIMGTYIMFPNHNVLATYSGGYETITGKIVDSKGSPVSDARIFLNGLDNVFIFSKEDGSFEVNFLKSSKNKNEFLKHAQERGYYIVTIYKEGYAPESKKVVTSKKQKDIILYQIDEVDFHNISGYILHDEKYDQYQLVEISNYFDNFGYFDATGTGYYEILVYKGQEIYFELLTDSFGITDSYVYKLNIDDNMPERVNINHDSKKYFTEIVNSNTTSTSSATVNLKLGQQRVGLVVNSKGEPVEGALVSVDGKNTFLTNMHGEFYFNEDGVEFKLFKIESNKYKSIDMLLPTDKDVVIKLEEIPFYENPLFLFLVILSTIIIVIVYFKVLTKHFRKI